MSNLSFPCRFWARIPILPGLLLSLLAVNGSPFDNEDHTEAIRIEGAIVKIIDSAEVPAELPGVLAEVNFREGQVVSKGELLAKIKSDDLRFELNRAKSRHQIATAKSENKIDIEFAKKSAEVSSAKLNRSRSSNRRAPGVVSQGRIQELELEVHRDQLQIQQATQNNHVAKMEMAQTQADVELSENSIKKASIVSPIDGVVVLVNKKVGEWIEPGDTVVKVVRLDRLRLEGFVSVSEAGKFHRGDPAVVTFKQNWLTKRKVEGTVLFINPEANPVNSQVEVWIEVKNPDRELLPGLEASVEIECSVQPKSNPDSTVACELD